MSDELLRVTDEPAASDLEFLEDQIDEFNGATTGYRDGRYLAIFVRDDRGAIRAGLSGHTWGGCAEVKFLWVREGERHAGLGTALLQRRSARRRRAAARRSSSARTASRRPRSTRSTATRSAVSSPDYPSGHAQIFLRKVLV